MLSWDVGGTRPRRSQARGRRVSRNGDRAPEGDRGPPAAPPPDSCAQPRGQRVCDGSARCAWGASHPFLASND